MVLFVCIYMIECSGSEFLFFFLGGGVVWGVYAVIAIVRDMLRSPQGLFLYLLISDSKSFLGLK